MPGQVELPLMKSKLESHVEGFMGANIRILGAIVAGLMLGGCAAGDRGLRTDRSTAAATNPNCLTETGSRIPVNDGNCSGFGRSYTSDDITRTGKTSAAEALQLLDPSIAVHR